MRPVFLAFVAVVFAGQLASHVSGELDRTVGRPSEAEVRALAAWMPGRIVTVTARPGPDGRVPLPAGWMSRRARRRAPPTSLLAFVDGRRVRHFTGDPALTSRDPYVYYRSARAAAMYVRCPEGETCREATLALPGVRLSAALLRARLRRFPLHAVTMAAGLMLWLAAASWATRSWPEARIGKAAAAAAIVLVAGLALDIPSPRWSLPVLLLAAGAPAGGLLVRAGRATAVGARAVWAAADSPRLDARAWLSRAGLLALVSCAVAVPHVVTGLSWYPADRDDSFLYLRGASRLLAAGSLLEGAARPDAWVYSFYPLALAALAEAAGVHPMVAYRWLGHAGAALLPAAMGLFAYAVTRRMRTTLLACWIAGLWGGLAGYLWLAREGLPAFVEHRAPPLLNDDYFEPRFLGEYAGPHSELTAYVCRVPLYPREAGLLLFWPALGLVYAGLPRPGVRRAAAFAALVIAAAAVYPYYGIPGVMVLAGLIVVAAGPGRRAPLLAVAITAGLAVLAVADHMVRLHKSPAGLFAYLLELWRQPAEGPGPVSPLRFTLGRVLGGHFFMIAAMGLACAAVSGAARRARSWPGWALFLPSLTLASAAGALAGWEPAARLLYPYGWIVPWRTLVEPVLVLGAAAAVGVLLDRLRQARRLYLAAPLLLVPVVSPLHWTLNADLYLRAEAERPWGRGRNRALYDEYARLGTAFLGRLKLREPVLVEARYVGPLEAALGIRALGAVAEYEPLIVYSQYDEMRELLGRKQAAGEIGDVAALRGGDFERRVAGSHATAPLAALGPYTILRWSPLKGPR